MSANYDAVVIGAGHNGMACACYLAKAGLKTLLLEKNKHIGGMSTTQELLLPGFHSDIHAFGYQFANLSPAASELNLRDHGLELITPEVPFAHVFPDGDSVYMSADFESTFDNIADHSKHDAEQWDALYRKWLNEKEAIIHALNSPPGTQSSYLAFLESMPNGLAEYRFDLQSLRGFCDDYFESDKIKSLLGSFGLHTTLSPDDMGSGKIAWLFDAIIQDYGNRPVKGGMGNLITSLEKSFAAAGGDIKTNAGVDHIVSENHKAKAIVLENGDIIDINGVVVSSVDPRQLVMQFLGEEVVGPIIVEKIRRLEWGVSTMVMYFALDRPLQFKAGEGAGSGAYVHISPPGFNVASQSAVESMSGMLPKEPFMLLCNDSIVDPTRAPDGKGLLKIMVYAVPYKVLGDAGGDIQGGDWKDIKEAYADRMVELLTRYYMPDFKPSIIARVVHSPVDQENGVVTAVKGTNTHGATPPYQTGAMRPIPELGQYRTPVKNVYMCGAGSFPGPGISFMPGRNSANVILRILGVT
jgi:phytoene dehydrogenase-like protein